MADPSPPPPLLSLNLPSSYMGGITLWAEGPQECGAEHRLDDGVLEVVGVYGSWHLGSLQVSERGEGGQGGRGGGGRRTPSPPDLPHRPLAPHAPPPPPFSPAPVCRFARSAWRAWCGWGRPAAWFWG